MPGAGLLALTALLAGGLTSACSGGTGNGAASAGSSPTTTAASAPSSSLRSGTAPATAGSTSSAASSGPADAGQWLSYHADQARTGAVSTGPTGRLTRRWRADLGGAVRGQALVVAGHVVAATETNRVVALDPGTGHLQWSASLGPALTHVARAAGCGNIDPLGVTSTPVADPATGTVYVVAEVDDGGGRVHHQLSGLDLATGKVVLSRPVDPPLTGDQRAVHLLQRASLALAGGRVYVSYGGNAGDCGDYHGWVVGAPVSGSGALVSFQAAPDGFGGAIWMSGGAPAVDAAGNLYVTTGNANPGPPAGGPDPLRYTESVVKLSPTLKVLASYKDQVAGGDEDLSTGNPVLLPDGRVFSVGKTRIGYLLGSRDLALGTRIKGVCGSNPDGGPAYDAATGRMFVPCRAGGIQVLDLRSGTLGRKLSGADSAPVVVAGTVWATDSESGTLTGFEAATGRRVQQLPVAGELPVFVSPSAGAGLLLVGTGRGVVAFG